LYFIFECSVINDGKFINNEFNDVYLVTTVDPIPLEAFTLQVRKCVLFILLWWVLVCVNTCFIYYRLVLIKNQFGEYDLFMLESFLFSCTFRLFPIGVLYLNFLYMFWYMHIILFSAKKCALFIWRFDGEWHAYHFRHEYFINWLLLLSCEKYECLFMISLYDRKQKYLLLNTFRSRNIEAYLSKKILIMCPMM